MSDLLSVRVMAEPPAAARAVDRLAEVLDLDRRDGPYPSRKTPDLVRFYLTGRLRPAAPAPADLSDRGEWLCSALVQLRERIVAVLEDETARSEEHTSELQSRENLVCRLLLEK